MGALCRVVVRVQAAGALCALDCVRVSLCTPACVCVCALWKKAKFVYPLPTRGIQASAMWSSIRNCMNKHE